MKIGYDYGRMVTGEEQQIESDLAEEAVQAARNLDPLEEKAMVVTSEEVMFVSDYFTTFPCEKGARNCAYGGTLKQDFA